MTTDNKHNETAHDHKHEADFPKMSKYEEALSKYQTDIDDNAVREALTPPTPTCPTWRPSAYIRVLRGRWPSR